MADAERDFLDEGGGSISDDENAYAALAAEEEAGKPSPGVESEEGHEEESEAGGKAAASEAGEEEEEGAADGRTVPLAALHEARHENRELREQFNSLQERFGQLSGLKRELEELRSQKKQESEAERQAREAEEFENDPVGYLKNRVGDLEGKLQKRDAETAEEKQQREEAEVQRAQVLEMQQKISTQVRDYIGKQPDYPEAFKYLMEARVAEYNALGITDPQQIAQMFDQESFALAQVAMKQGKNPGEAAYALAKARGYKPKPAGDDNGGDDDTLAAQLNKLEQGQKAAKTLSGGGHERKSDLSLADIDTLSDEEFDKLFDEMGNAEHHGSIFDE